MPTDIAIEAAAALSQGARARQEDAVASAFPDGAPLGFAVLSDGMGGHAAGDLASRMIVAEIFAGLTIASARPAFAPADLPALLGEAVGLANDCLAAEVAEVPQSRGMGGTVVATAVYDGRLYWASVGDSLLYLYREGRLARLNADHSMAPQIDLLVSRGVIDAETGRNHPQRSCLTSALTGDRIDEIDCPAEGIHLRAGDILVVASDGLLTLPEARIAAILRRTARRDGAAIARALIDAVAGAGDPGQDNTSLVVLKVRPRAPARNMAGRSAPGAVLQGLAQALWSPRPRSAGSG